GRERSAEKGRIVSYDESVEVFRRALDASSDGEPLLRVSYGECSSETPQVHAKLRTRRTGASSDRRQSVAEYIPYMQLKAVELWWRRQWIRFLVRLMRRPGGERPDWAARPYRVLFLPHCRRG